MSENNSNDNSTEENLEMSEENSDISNAEDKVTANLDPDSENGKTDKLEANVGEEETGSRFQEYFNEKIESRHPKMTDTLLVFHELREIDEELTDIEDEKGDLPEKINAIRTSMLSLDHELQEKREYLSGLNEEKTKTENDNGSYEERINKYDEQKYDVRSNKEYDEIVKTIDSLFEEVKKNEIRLKEILEVTLSLESDMEKLLNDSQELSSDLTGKQTLLDELDEQYKQDESALRDKRNILLSKLDSASSTLYERINNSYKGEATAIVRKGNCSGCYNSIPPQRVIEIKSAEKIYTCQSCGRILIAEEILPTS